MKRLLGLLMAVAMLLSIAPNAALAAGAVWYQNDFAKPIEEIRSDSNLAFIQPEKISVVGEKLSIPETEWAVIFYNNPLTEFPYTVSADITVKKTADNLTGMSIGVRAPNTTVNFTGPGGLYAVFSGRQVFILKGGDVAGGVVVNALPASVANENKVWIEDKGTEIAYYIGDGAEKTLAAKVTFDGTTATITDSKGRAKGTIEGVDLSGGYVSFMPHFCGGMIDNLKVFEGADGLDNLPPPVPSVPVLNVSEQNGETAYAYDFNAKDSKIKSDLSLGFMQPENYIPKDGKLTTSAAVWSNMSFGIVQASTQGYRFEGDVSIKTQDKDNPIVAFSIGVRVADPGLNFLSSSGLWAFAKNQQLFFIRGGDTSDISRGVMVDGLPVDFNEETHLTIADNGKDEICYYGGPDKTLLARVAVGENTVTIYDGAGNEKGTINEIDILVGKSLNIMPHFVDSTLTNVVIYLPAGANSKGTPINILKYRDVYSDTWGGVDDLGREMPTFAEVGSPKDKAIGIFYLVWNNRDRRDGIYDHYKTYLEGGTSALWEVMKQGPQGYPHYWAEPYFGYYRVEDEWILRKHATQLVNAGVDFIWVDISNEEMYAPQMELIFETWAKMRNEGLATPQIVFFSGTFANFGLEDAKFVWNNYYRDEKYKELWFMWEGKPLILANFDYVEDEEVKNFFTIRESWAYRDWVGDGINKWSWICEYPQVPGRNEDGEIEQLSVTCGYHANTHLGLCRGRSFSNGAQPTDGMNDFEFGLMDSTTPLGLAFEEQWSEAFKIDPPLLLITGWNEWGAGRWEDMAAGQKIANTYICVAGDPKYKHYYVDSFNPEYSRDIEPMRGGFGDNYYNQMAQNIRKFRGARPVQEAGGQKTIDLALDFSQWDGVYPEFRDAIGDTFHRDFDAMGGTGLRYTNTSGRNDIEVAKVSRDDDNAYFYVRTHEAITAPEGKNWMNLYINADNNTKTGWKGFDLRVNWARNDKTCSVELSSDGWNWQSIGDVSYRYEGNHLHLAIPKSVYDLSGDFEFKWADNSVSSGDVMEFLDLGDAAPDDRFTYRFQTKKESVVFSEAAQAALNGSVAMKINSYLAYNGTERVMLDSQNTNITPAIYDDSTMVPVRFVTENMGGEVSWNNDERKATVSIAGYTVEMTIGQDVLYLNGQAIAIPAPARIEGGRTLLPLRALTEAIGKKVTWDPRGLIIIGDQEVTDQEVLDEIYRAI